MAATIAKAFDSTFTPSKMLKSIHSLGFLNAVTQINEDFESNCHPYLLKDNFAKKGMKLTCASEALRNFVSPYDSTVVTRLRKKGFDVLAKTNLDEFAMGSGSVEGIFGPVKNPWSLMTQNFDPNSGDFVIAGGSSGGSAAAVAANLTPFAIGSDTGGSVRLPAAFCGVLGFKPSYGTVSRHGLVSLANFFDTPGIFARSADVIEEVFKMLIEDGDCQFDSTCDTSILDRSSSLDNSSPVRVGIPQEYHVAGLSPELRNLWDDFACRLQSELNWEVVKCNLPMTRYVIPCYSVLSAADVASNMARYDGIEFGSRLSDEELENCDDPYKATRTKFLGQTVKRRILIGNYFSLKENLEKYYIKALKVRRLIFEEFVTCFKADNLDLLLTPVSLNFAPLYSEFMQKDMRTQTEVQDVLVSGANLGAIPACSFPVKLSENSNLPLSLQIMAPFGHDLKLLNLLKKLTELTKFDYTALDDKIQNLKS